jgi:hypothetical protein
VHRRTGERRSPDHADQIHAAAARSTHGQES